MLSVLELYFRVELHERYGVQEQQHQLGILVVVRKRCDGCVVLCHQCDCLLLNLCVGNEFPRFLPGAIVSSHLW